jgi:large subunit ribosomal protein L23
MSQLSLVPRISEKSINQAANGVYFFDVPMTANKILVRRAVKDQFKVEVEAVNMAIHKGKVKVFRRITGRRSDTKVAVVKLKKGQSIKLFEESK